MRRQKRPRSDKQWERSYQAAKKKYEQKLEQGKLMNEFPKSAAEYKKVITNYISKNENKYGPNWNDTNAGRDFVRDLQIVKGHMKKQREHLQKLGVTESSESLQQMIGKDDFSKQRRYDYINSLISQEEDSPVGIDEYGNVKRPATAQEWAEWRNKYESTVNNLFGEASPY